MIDPGPTARFVDDVWNRSILPAIQQYIAIPNKSPAFDQAWQANGHMERAVALIAAWCRSEGLPNVEPTIEIDPRAPALETTLDWLVGYLSPAGVVVVWVDAQNPAGQQNLRAALERRGFHIETGTSHEFGFAISARRSEMNPMSKAA